ncbi:hypothetical protein K3495_g1015 [Podosphaera aphanis]|nr:hypothetical protein K3495_g1015 [Podosphaera aphanis]
MIIHLSVLALTASFSHTFVRALSSLDIPAQTPISALLATADAHLAKGETSNALIYYDVAISRDPQNYLTLFKRGATYLSLGRHAQATSDFDKVLTLKPGFEGALLQRAHIKARSGDWDAAKRDYLAHGKSKDSLAELKEAQKAATLAVAAESKGKWDECVEHAGRAINVASKMAILRKTRANCRFNKGEAQEGISDLRHLLQLEPGATEPYMQISAITFYGLSDMEHGIDHMRKCLHSDPDSKKCKTLYRREKSLEKQLAQVKKNLERHQYATAIKILLASANGEGLVQEVKDDLENLRKDGILLETSPKGLYVDIVEMTCEAYHAQKNYQKAHTWCEEALTYNKHSRFGLLAKAQRQIQTEEYDAAVGTLSAAAEHYPDDEDIAEMLQEAKIEAKRAKNKDYYKVLGVSRDADELQIKSAYRRMTKLHHPDKAHKQGIQKEVAEKKMAAVNEAYEVLGNKELKKRYDQGDDPNSQEPQYGQPFEQGEWFMPNGGSFPFGQGANFKFKFNGQEFRYT